MAVDRRAEPALESLLLLDPPRTIAGEAVVLSEPTGMPGWNSLPIRAGGYTVSPFAWGCFHGRQPAASGLNFFLAHQAGHDAKSLAATSIVALDPGQFADDHSSDHRETSLARLLQ